MAQSAGTYSIYTAVVRPCLDYAGVILVLCDKTQAAVLEMVQKSSPQDPLQMLHPTTNSRLCGAGGNMQQHPLAHSLIQHFVPQTRTDSRCGEATILHTSVWKQTDPACSSRTVQSRPESICWVFYLWVFYYFIVVFMDFYNLCTVWLYVSINVFLNVYVWVWMGAYYYYILWCKVVYWYFQFYQCTFLF